MSKKLFRNFSLTLITLIALTFISSNAAFAVNVMPSSVSGIPAGGYFSVTVYATGSWNAYSENPNIAYPTNPSGGYGNGSFIVYVSQNTSPNPRGTLIHVSGNGPTATVVVNQLGTVYCGNGACDGTENFQTCNADCDPYCGDDICSSGENCSNCGTDCGACPGCTEQCANNYDSCIQDVLNIYASCGSNTSCHLYVYQMWLACESMYDACMFQCQ